MQGLNIDLNYERKRFATRLRIFMSVGEGVRITIVNDAPIWFEFNRCGLMFTRRARDCHAVLARPSTAGPCIPNRDKLPQNAFKSASGEGAPMSLSDPPGSSVLVAAAD